jgi:hypothetical protein
VEQEKQPKKIKCIGASCHRFKEAMLQGSFYKNRIKTP